jgi:hypothetical protein
MPALPTISAKAAERTYVVEMAIAAAAYVGLLYVRRPLLAVTSDPALGVAIKLAPILPVYLIALAVWRHYRRIDEYARLKLLEALALAGGFTALISTTYIILEDVGLPHLDLLWTMPLFGVSWAAASFLRQRPC